MPAGTLHLPNGSQEPASAEGEASARWASIHPACEDLQGPMYWLCQRRATMMPHERTLRFWLPPQGSMRYYRLWEHVSLTYCE